MGVMGFGRSSVGWKNLKICAQIYIGFLLICAQEIELQGRRAEHAIPLSNGSWIMMWLVCQEIGIGLGVIWEAGVWSLWLARNDIVACKE